MPIPTDPFLASQWHLGNIAGLFDLNVRSVWSPISGAAYTGAGTRVVVIDDGFDYTHSDLAPNFNTFLDYDFDNFTLDSFGLNNNSHGTAVAGIIAADNNGTGAVGVAYDAELVGYRIYPFITDEWLQNIRDAIHHAAVSAQGDVVNISQGIANDANSEFGIGYNAVRFDEIETSIGTAVSQGRGGLGTTIVKSAGNSRADNYDVNADDWTNDTRQVVVGAVDQNGFVSSYSSYGAALLVSAFGTPGEVVTTDRTGTAGYNNTDFAYFNGTSAAAPMVSGIVSLMYEANAGLGWRDVQSILANSARHVGSDLGAGTAGFERYAWQWNGAENWNNGGLHFSNDYGYGLVDALAAVRLAETWLIGSTAQTTANEFTNTIDMLNSTWTVPDGNASGFTFSGNAVWDDLVDRVTVQVTFSTTWTGDLELYVTSPNGTVSELIDDTGGSSDFNGTWTFESQAFRGERAQGTWAVRIVDDASGDTLQVSDIVVRTFGMASVNDRYVYTNEFSDYVNTAGHGTTLVDTNGGIDTINAAAVTTSSIIKLIQGSTSTIDGVNMVVNSQIENAIGGDGSDRLYGNALANTLAGGRGNDTYYVGAGDSVIEAARSGIDTVRSSVTNTLTANIEHLVLTGSADIFGTGNSLANRITGNAGDNILNGKLGNDILTGGAGIDIFRFNTKLAANNVDRIADFKVNVDEIQIENGVFKAVGARLTADEFVANTSGTAQNSAQHILYDTTDGRLFYDADGNGGQARVHFATLSAGLALDHLDFLVM